MKFQPRSMGDAAEASSGGGRKGIRRELLVLGLLSAALILGVWLLFSAAADLAIHCITPEQETRLFSGIEIKLKRWRPSASADRERLTLLERTLEKLAAHPGVPKLPYRIIPVDEEKPNAFAFPGGTIGVTKGLIHALGDDEIPIAFVLAHELGHYRNRDHLRRLVRDFGAGVTMQLIFGSAGGLDLASAAGRLVGLSYSRAQEEAADSFALLILNEIYGKTEGSERLFETLLKSGALPGWAYMFSTHPDTAGRIKRIQSHPGR